MEQEIELKLLAPKNAGEVIEQSFLPYLGGQYETESFELSNYYFDTPSRKLRQLDMGLRIRGKGSQFEQTLKTSGKSIGGLHQRPEFNVQLSNVPSDTELVPNLSLFESNVWPQGFDLENTQAQLSTLFVTRFTRTSYLVDLSNGSQVELVWDRGYVSANGQSKNICEIELELKKGQVQDLFSLAELLLSFMYLTIGKDSKAAQGYRLADLQPMPKPEFDYSVLNAQIKLQGSQFNQVVEQALTFLQYNLDLLAREYSHSTASALVDCLSVLQNVFEQVDKNDAENNGERILLNLNTLHKEWATLFKHIKDLPHTEVPLEKVVGVLFQSQVTQIQLDIVQFLLAKTSKVDN